jgi:nucleoside phosphorylase
VLSAFPAELAPHVARATIDDTIVIEGRVFRVGVLEGVPVVLALTGIGLVNAAATTRKLLERFDVRGVVVSAVAGSSRLQIGDVAVPAVWAAKDGTACMVHQEWLELADEIAAPGTVSLERCTLVPSASEEPVCLPREPAVVVGGVGQSSDPFHGKPFPCRPGGGDVFGCDVDSVAAGSTARAGHHAIGALASADPEAPAVNDMETAAIACEAAARGVPFIAFRAVSDGPGDPLGLPGFLEQFSAYYRLAARNAAAATVTFLELVAAATPVHARDAAARHGAENLRDRRLDFTVPAT